jgi:hypothetical protein
MYDFVARPEVTEPAALGAEFLNLARAVTVKPLHRDRLQDDPAAAVVQASGRSFEDIDGEAQFAQQKGAGETTDGATDDDRA